MTPPTSKNPLQHLRASDLRAAAQLASQATVGVSRIVEGVHQSVWRTLGAPGGATPGQARGLTGLVYRAVEGSAQLLGKGAQGVLTRLEPLLATADAQKPGSPQREAVLAALNGVMGDRLAASGNPLATPMTLRWQGTALDWQAPPQDTADMQVTGKVLLLIHGLCMNDLQWQVAPGTEQVDLGAALAASLGYTPVHLRYNTGQHISDNGLELARQLEQLAQHWPVPLQEITVLAHSMGGLVTRSAVHQAHQQGQLWPTHLKNIVFLGTPHHGAPLERAGNWVDVLLGSSRFSAPFARLAQLRSAGITDLRYGHLLAADWQGRDRFRREPDSRALLPLPEAVACYTVAATTASKRSLLADRLVGDGLVPLRSALGQHDDATRTLAFAKTAQWIAYRTHHMALLHSAAVGQQVKSWLAAEA
ncbi:MAG: alpha/beta hydrolase [Xylophilus sp.]|nr:alpha/beta hydrolase [Xylophilus sp.]